MSCFILLSTCCPVPTHCMRPYRPPLCVLGRTQTALAAIIVLVAQIASAQFVHPGTLSLQEKYPTHNWGAVVREEWDPDPSIFKSVTRDEDQLNIYAENLEPDLAIWRYRAPLKTEDLVTFIKGLKQRTSRRTVAIRHGQVHVLTVPPDGSATATVTDGVASAPLLVSSTCPQPCDSLLDRAVEDLRNWTRLIDFPDVLFFLNGGDVNICKGPSREANAKRYKPCTAPVFSFQKEWDERRDEDILIPLTSDIHHPLYYLSWREKIDRAFFRGTSFCHSRTYPYAKDICSRTYLARMSLLPEPGQLLDVGFINNWTAPSWTLSDKMDISLAAGKGKTVSELSSLPVESCCGLSRHAELARFKYLLHLDGITASTRLAKLLHTDSVVFKQKSPWIEWYYRSLVEGQHYFSFWETHRNDVFQIIKYLRHKSRYLQDVAEQGQIFAHAYTSPTARMLYWRRALTGYKQLFPDMDVYLSKL